MLPNFSYVRPASVSEAVEQAATEGARVHSGGTDLLGCLRDEIFDARKVVSLSALHNLKGIEKQPDGGVRIGALTTITQVSEDPVIRTKFPALAQAASEVASPQLRNQGTIGGNLCQNPRCWYYRGDFHCRRKGGPTCFAFDGENQFHGIFGSGGICCIVHPSDPAPALAALQAEVKIARPDGTRAVPVDQFFVLPEQDVQRTTVLKPGEIITEIVIPAPSKNLKSSYRKIRARRSWDFALAGAALAVTFNGAKVEGARVFLSGAAPVPWRSRAVEEAISGKALNDTSIDQAAEAIVADAKPLQKNGYKIPLFKAMIGEELTALSK